MYQGRNYNRNSRSPYSRPEGQQQPSWMGAQDQWQGGESPLAGQPWQEEPAYQEPYEEQQAWEEQPYEEPPYEEPMDDRYARPMPDDEPVEEIIATNSTVRLTCTLASMLGLFALFLCFAEKKSRAIRHFSVQSAGLMLCHLAIAVILMLVGTVLGVIPFLGFLMNLVCWLVYIAVLIVTLFIKVRMMLFAWRGVRFTLPVIGHKLQRFC